MKRSKKAWARTEREQRRDHAHSRRYYGTPPKWYSKTFHVKEKHRTQNELRKVILGENPDRLLIFHTYNHRNIAKWYWF